MKITYLKLENFSMVKSGMGLDTLELDFTKGKNMITLIVGNNGTGKTGGILSNIHPYAGLGHLETRDDSDIIIPGKNGHKIAIFKTKKHEYYIEHHYAWQGPKRSRKISSYIKKDGKELNPSGTVTGFNMFIETEFKIDPNFLKLLRLGPNVKNFISLSATERKSFISKLLASTEIYLKDQKVANEQVNYLATSLKIAVKKKEQLNVEDITLLQKEISDKEAKIKSLQQEKEEVIKDFSSYSAIVNVEAITNNSTNIKNLSSEKRDIESSINSLTKPKYVHIKFNNQNPIERYSASIDKLNEERTKYAIDISKINIEISSIDNDITTLDSEYTKSLSERDINETKEYLKELKEKELSLSKELQGKNEPSITKDELTKDLDKINLILFNLNEIISLPNLTLEYYYEIFNNFGTNLDKMKDYLNNRINKVAKELSKLDTGVNPNGGIRIMILPSECTCAKKCPYYNLYQNSESGIKKNKIRELEEEYVSLNNINTILFNNLFHIFKILSMRTINIKEYSITTENVIKAIFSRTTEDLINYKTVTDLLQVIELYEEYNKITKLCEDTTKELNYLKSIKQSKSSDELIDEINKLTITKNNLKEKLNKKMDKMNKLNKEISKMKDLLQDYSTEVEYNNQKTNLMNKISIIDKELNKCYELQKYESEFYDRKEYHDSRIAFIVKHSKELEDEIFNLKVKENLFKEVEKEIEYIESMYNYAEYIRDAVSSKSGIPKVFVEHYCRSLKSIANEIISQIYNGELVLRNFNITDTKFDIPYYTKGTNVSDIRFASQAEVSVVTIAISFAILMQFIPKYNIVLLDEIDGPMHHSNKEKLFAALEGQLKNMGCEQIFLITQSKLFNDYPVNIISTDSEYTNSIENKKNVIFAR